MPTLLRTLAPLLAAALVLLACTGGGPMAPTEPAPSGSSPVGPGSPTASGGAASLPTPTVSDDGAAGSPTAAPGPLADRPWATAPLTDVATGETFRIADLAADHRIVFVEAMAIWCTSCRRQQAEFTAALAGLDPAEVAYVALTIDPSETADALARYRDTHGFTGRYAVAGPDVSAALAEEFGPTILNPPSVPILVVRSDGGVEFRTGHHGADDIVALVAG